MGAPMDLQFFYFMLIGFFAQLVDGALGMAYGVTATTFLFTVGVPPAAASASVHAAEIVTTGASGLSHLALRNIDRGLFRQLLLPGVAGAAAGAWLLTTLPTAPLKLAVALYLGIMGGLVLRRAWKHRHGQPGRLPRGRGCALGLAGGFFDAVGGGGWGPIVTSSLLARGGEPRYIVGSVNLVEFFVAVAASMVFVLTIGLGYWRITLGLIAGGLLGAPLGAVICRWLPPRVLMAVIGTLIILLSLRTVAHLLAGIP
jgi:hypothetical protein